MIQNFGQFGGTGGAVWGGSIALSRYIFKNLEEIKHYVSGGEGQIVELGCGAGLVGIVLGKLGFKIISTDGEKKCIELSLNNLKKNNMRDNNYIEENCLSFETLSWTEKEIKDFKKRDFFQEKNILIIGSDLFWDFETANDLFETLLLFTDNNNNNN